MSLPKLIKMFASYLIEKKKVVKIKLQKKGSLAKSEKNETVIVGEDQKPYKVNETIVVIWNMCDGTLTEENILDTLSKETKTKKEEIGPLITDIINRLKEASLVEEIKQ